MRTLFRFPHRTPTPLLHRFGPRGLHTLPSLDLVPLGRHTLLHQVLSPGFSQSFSTLGHHTPPPGPVPLEPNIRLGPLGALRSQPRLGPTRGSLPANPDVTGPSPVTGGFRTPSDPGPSPWVWTRDVGTRTGSTVTSPEGEDCPLRLSVSCPVPHQEGGRVPDPVV